MENFKYLSSTKTLGQQQIVQVTENQELQFPSGGWLNSRTLEWQQSSIPTQSEVSKNLGVECTCIYGADAWTLCKADENRIMAAEMWFWRRLPKISWKEKRTNVNVLNELGVKRELLGKIVALKMGYFGHMIDRKRRRGDKRNNGLITLENGQELAIPKPSP